MNSKLILCLTLILSSGLFGCSTVTHQSLHSPNPESFDLEIALSSPINRDFTMLTTISVEKPFELIAVDGATTNKISGILHAPKGGTYPLHLAVSEWVSEKNHAKDDGTLNLKLGKPWGGGPVSSVVYVRWVTLRKHESIFKKMSE